MACNTWTAVLLWLLLSTLCVTMADARTIHRRKRYVETFGGDSAKISELGLRRRNDSNTYCFETEPCQFGLYKKSQGRMYAFVLIPSWCTCMPDQRCAVDRYDQKKKAEIYTCQLIP